MRTVRIPADRYAALVHMLRWVAECPFDIDLGDAIANRESDLTEGTDAENCGLFYLCEADNEHNFPEGTIVGEDLDSPEASEVRVESL